MELTEKEAGFTLENQYGYICSPATEPYLYFGEGTFEGVDPNCEKFHIYVVSHETCPPCGGVGMLVLNDIDLEIAEGEGWSLVHEYTHSLQAANGIWLNGNWLEENKERIEAWNYAE